MMLMDEGARLWTIKTARYNFWRVQQWYELDDLIQDGFMQWYRIAQKYSHVKDRPHLMRIYQLTFWCWITDLANKRTRQPQEVLSCNLAREGETEIAWDALVPYQPEIQTFWLMVEQAPSTIRKVIDLLSTEHGRRRLAAPYRVRKSGRETLNERLCRLVGVNSSIDLVGEVRRYFAIAA
jgi:hypothetical protein